MGSRTWIVRVAVVCLPTACSGEVGSTDKAEIGSASSASSWHRVHSTHHRRHRHHPRAHGRDCERQGWSRHFGAGPNQAQAGYAVALDNQGNAIVAGTYTHGITFDEVTLGNDETEFPSNDMNAYVATFDPCGHTLRAEGGTTGDDQVQTASQVAIGSSGHITLAGAAALPLDFGDGPITPVGSSGGYLANLDAAGGTRWAISTGTTVASAVVIDPENDIIVGANRSEPSGIAGGIFEGKVAKYDDDGNELWAHVFSSSLGSLSSAGISDVTVDSAGNVWAAGEFEGASLELLGQSFPSTSGEGNHTSFLVQFDPGGVLISIKIFTSAPWGLGLSKLAADPSGGVVLAGTYIAEVDFGGGPLPLPSVPPGVLQGTNFLVKFDAEGRFVWNDAFPGAPAGGLFPHGLDPHGLTIDRQGNVVLAGSHMGGSIDFGGATLVNPGPLPDVFVAKFDRDGHHLFSSTFGDSDHQEGLGLVLDEKGNAILTGFFAGQIDFGQGPLVANSTNVDVFVAKVDLSH